MSPPEASDPIPAPNLVEIAYDDVALTVTALWQPLPGYADFVVVLLKGGAAFAKGTGFGATGTVKLTAPLPVGTGAFEVQVAALQDGQPGPFGNRIKVITGRISALSATTEPARIDAAWTLPQGSELTNGAQLAVLGPSGGLVARESLMGTEGALGLSAALDPAASYKLRARPLFGQSYGPYLDLPLVTVPAEIAEMTYEPGAKPQISVLAQPPVPASCLAGADLFADGVPVGSTQGKSGALVVVAPDAPLGPGVAWEVRPFWWSGEARGPHGAAVPVLVDSPAVRAVEATGSGLTVSWSTYPGPPYPSGAELTVTPLGASGEAPRRAFFLGVCEGSFEPQPPLSSGTAYALTVASLREPSFGPAGPPVPVFAAQPPAPSWARYDGARLAAGWQATVPQGATGCCLVVLQGGSEIARLALPAAAAGAAIELPLGGAAGPYAVALRWTAERSRGPLGPRTDVIAAVPGVSSIAVTDTAVEVTVEPPPSTTGIGSYVAALFRDGEQLAEARVSTPSSGKPVAPISYATDGRAGYEVRVSAASATGAGVPESTGPASAAVPVPSAPRVTSAVLRGSQLTLAWEPSARPRPASTTVVVTPSSGDAVTFPGLPGSTATVTLPASLLAPGLTLTVQASCATALGTTPLGAALKLLTATPELRSARFDGERVTAAWAWPQGAPDALIATSYRLSLWIGGVPVRSAIVAGLGGTLVPGMDFSPTAAAELRIDALAGAAEALAAAGTALVVAPPRLLGAAVEGSTVTLTFAGVTSPGECDAVFSSPGREAKVLANLGTSPAIVTIPTLAADPLVPLEVALVTRAGAAEGPHSEPLPVLRAPVAPRLAAVDGDELTVEWDEVPGATAYLATLYEAGSAAGTASVKGPPARLDASGAKPVTAYTVGVLARAGAAAGPAAIPLPVLLAVATLGKPSFDGSVLSATVTAPSGTGATLSGYELSLLRNGEVVQTVDREVPGEDPLQLAVDSPVDPLATYELAVRPRAGAALGPPAEVAVLLVPPSLDSVRWGNGTLTVCGSAGDLQAAGLTIYATLFQAGQDPQVKALTAGSAAFTASAGAVCEVSLHGETPVAVGPPSPRLTALTAAPTIVSARVAAGRVTAVWSEVAARAYAVAITDDKGATVAAATVEGLAAELDLALVSGAGYMLAVTPLAGRVSGPPVSLPLVTAGCRTAAACRADGRTVRIEWSLEAGGPTPTGFVPVVRWEETEVELDPQPAAATSAEIVLPAAVPAGAAIGVKALAGAAVGPIANLAPVLAGAPEDLFLRYAEGTLRASWRPPADARITGALVTLNASGKETATPVAGGAWSAAVAVDSAATVSVAVTAGDGTGPAVGPVAALLAAPTVEKCSFDGSLLEVAWATTGLAGATAWRVVAEHRDRVIAEATVAAAKATLPLPTQSLPFEAIGDLTVTVTALAPGAEGPESAPTKALAIAPRVTAAVTDGLTGVTTVTWTAVATTPAPTYVLSRYLDGALVETTDTTATSAALPALEPERDCAVAVAALVPPGSLEGPPGPRFRVPTGTPVVESVSFDGAVATVRWRGVAGASGYAIDVFGGTPPSSIGGVEVGAGAREARVSVTIDVRQAGRQVSVRALFGPSSGPRGLRPLFSPGIYLGGGEPPRLLRAGSEAIEAEPQIAYLPPIGLETTKLPLGPVQAGTSPPTKPFVLAANTDATSSAAFPYTLRIDNGALVFDSTRATLRETFLELLVEAEREAGAKPWGLFAIQAAVARLMPQTFEETLLYSYGLDLEKGCVDLAPGMVLQVAFSEFDAIAAERSPATATGYAGGAVVEYELGDYFAGADWLVGFDAFLAWLAGNSVIEVPAPVPGSAPPGPDFSESGGAEAADLFFPGFRTPFHRLLVPRNLLSPNAAASGRTKDQFTLVAAAKFADLQGAGAAPVPTKTSVAYFRGRAVVKPSLRIGVDGEQRLVPIGTTVGNVLDSLGRRPPSTAAALRGVSLERSPGPVVLDPARGYDAAAVEPVALDWEGLRTFGAPRGTLSLPLLHGDRLTVTG